MNFGLNGLQIIPFFSTVFLSNSTVCVLKIRQFKTVEFLYSTVFLSKIKPLDVENQMFENVEL